LRLRVPGFRGIENPLHLLFDYRFELLNSISQNHNNFQESLEWLLEEQLATLVSTYDGVQAVELTHSRNS
jgi:hypothetical protein